MKKFLLLNENDARAVVDKLGAQFVNFRVCGLELMHVVAIIKKIGVCLPDPDNGKTYGRLLTTPNRTVELLNWKETGKLQVEEALRLAKEQLKLNNFNDKEEYV